MSCESQQRRARQQNLTDVKWPQWVDSGQGLVILTNDCFQPVSSYESAVLLSINYLCSRPQADKTAYSINADFQKNSSYTYRCLGLQKENRHDAHPPSEIRSRCLQDSPL
jgi:hypothetical protein